MPYFRAETQQDIIAYFQNYASKDSQSSTEVIFTFKTPEDNLASNILWSD